jgi:hypothetical protein
MKNEAACCQVLATRVHLSNCQVLATSFPSVLRSSVQRCVKRCLRSETESCILGDQVHSRKIRSSFPTSRRSTRCKKQDSSVRNVEPSSLGRLRWPVSRTHARSAERTWIDGRPHISEIERSQSHTQVTTTMMDVRKKTKSQKRSVTPAPGSSIGL